LDTALTRKLGGGKGRNTGTAGGSGGEGKGAKKFGDFGFGKKRKKDFKGGATKNRKSIGKTSVGGPESRIIRLA